MPAAAAAAAAGVSTSDPHEWSTDAFKDGIPNADPAFLQEALDTKSLGFSFSGGGFLLPYYLGTIKALMELGLVRPGTTHVGGSSAGSLIAAVLTAGIPLQEVVAAVKLFMAECRKSGVFRKLGPGLRTSLEALLPKDAHERCSGTAHIAITKVKPYGALHSKRVQSFASKEDLIGALLASCHLPMLSTGSLTMKFRGRRVVDGGVTDLMPVPCAPKHVVKITCLPLSSMKRMPMRNRHVTEQHISISPCRFRAWPWDHKLTIKYMLGPGPEEVVDWLMAAGEQDIASWAVHAGMILSSPLVDLAITTVDSYKRCGAADDAAEATEPADEEGRKTGHGPAGKALHAVEPLVPVPTVVAVGAAAGSGAQVMNKE